MECKRIELLTNIYVVYMLWVTNMQNHKTIVKYATVSRSGEQKRCREDRIAYDEFTARRFVQVMYGSRDRSEPCLVRALRRASGAFVMLVWSCRSK